MTGKSRPDAAWTMRRPRPGHENTVSMMMAPLSMKPRRQPGDGHEGQGGVPERMAVEHARARAAPLARAVRT